MKISILMATDRNRPHFAEALASIRAQTHAEWDLLVVQYGLPDETRTLVHEFGVLTGHSVTHLALGENHGSASARNRLLELATSDWVAFLDPSDQWTPHHLANAAQKLAGPIDVVSSDVRLERPLHAISERSPPAQLDHNPLRTLFVADALPFASALAFRREFAARAGFFDSQFKVGEARDFWLRCAVQGARFARTLRATCHVHRGTLPDPAQTLLQADQQVRFFEKHRDLPGVPAALRRQSLSTSLVAKGRLLRAADPAAALPYFLRAWSLQPMHIQTLGQLALAGCRLAAIPALRGEGVKLGDTKLQPTHRGNGEESS